jgi:hypothetical protein
MICLLFVMGVGNPWVCYTRWVMGTGKNSPQGGEWGWGWGNFTNAGTGKKRQSPRGGRPVAIPCTDIASLKILHEKLLGKTHKGKVCNTENLMIFNRL